MLSPPPEMKVLSVLVKLFWKSEIELFPKCDISQENQSFLKYFVNDCRSQTKIKTFPRLTIKHTLTRFTKHTMIYLGTCQKSRWNGLNGQKYLKLTISHKFEHSSMPTKNTKQNQKNVIRNYIRYGVCLKCQMSVIESVYT